MKKRTRDVIHIILVTIAISTVIYLVLDLNTIRASRQTEVLMSFIEIAIVVTIIVFIFRYDMIVGKLFKK